MTDLMTFYLMDGKTAYNATNGPAVQHGTPVLVIDPEDAESVTQLVCALADQGWRPTTAHGCRAALRSLLTPPKPDEPQGLGAVVEDADGVRWTRTQTPPNPGRWRADTPPQVLPGFAGYDEINAVRVLSEGVTA